MPAGSTSLSRNRPRRPRGSASHHLACYAASATYLCVCVYFVCGRERVCSLRSMRTYVRGSLDAATQLVCHREMRDERDILPHWPVSTLHLYLNGFLLHSVRSMHSSQIRAYAVVLRGRLGGPVLAIWLSHSVNRFPNTRFCFFFFSLLPVAKIVIPTSPRAPALDGPRQGQPATLLCSALLRTSYMVTS